MSKIVVFELPNIVQKNFVLICELNFKQTKAKI